jgi:predicted Fe-Mo cluster-binding NifX family protein
MKCAIPTAKGMIAEHFGHCEEFVFFNIDGDNKITWHDYIKPPAHEPGVFPKWLAGQGVTVVIASGMGMRARRLFGENGIEVVVGSSESDPRTAVQKYLDGNLETVANICDH